MREGFRLDVGEESPSASVCGIALLFIERFIKMQDTQFLTIFLISVAGFFAVSRRSGILVFLFAIAFSPIYILWVTVSEIAQIFYA